MKLGYTDYSVSYFIRFLSLEVEIVDNEYTPEELDAYESLYGELLNCLVDISKNTQTLILTIFSGAIATYEDS